MIAKIIIAKRRRSAIFTSGPIALAIADITTCKPEISEINKNSKKTRGLNELTHLHILFSFYLKKG